MGRPYGGCSILYRKSLSFISPLVSYSDRYCAAKLCVPNGLSYLLICVYIMPSDNHQSSLSEYIEILGEIQSFTESHPCDTNVLVGDFMIELVVD